MICPFLDCLLLLVSLLGASIIREESANLLCRPFGSSALLAVWDDIDGPQLYLTEPSGLSMVWCQIIILHSFRTSMCKHIPYACPRNDFWPDRGPLGKCLVAEAALWGLLLNTDFWWKVVLQRYFGTAVGKNKQAAKTEIERLKLEDLDCRQGVLEVAKMWGPYLSLSLQLILHPTSFNRLDISKLSRACRNRKILQAVCSVDELVGQFPEIWYRLYCMSGRIDRLIADCMRCMMKKNLLTWKWPGYVTPLVEISNKFQRK